MSATEQVLADFPKGSLAGAVHAAAANKSRPWSNKLMDSVDDFKIVIEVNAYGTFLINACIADASKSCVTCQHEGNFGLTILLPLSQFPIPRRRKIPETSHRRARCHCQLCLGGSYAASRTMPHLRPIKDGRTGSVDCRSRFPRTIRYQGQHRVSFHRSERDVG